ncbi:MAG: GNAT family N-acetyltransferase [Rhizomicrobium sp.]|nr:GNAT family N-acetyltransferase [Rhizomicrobium sp.]
MIPRLETDRLVLRAFRAEDFEAWAAIMGDADVMTFLGGPMVRTDAWRAMAMTLGHWALRGYGMWAVERKEDSVFIGRVGMLNPEGWTGLEVGWTLGKAFWGQGYATEAAACAMRFAFLTQAVERVVSNIDAGNTASQAVALRLGESKGPCAELSVAGHKMMVDVWSISREEWQRRV